MEILPRQLFTQVTVAGVFRCQVPHSHHIANQPKGDRRSPAQSSVKLKQAQAKVNASSRQLLACGAIGLWTGIEMGGLPVVVRSGKSAEPRLQAHPSRSPSIRGSLTTDRMQAAIACVSTEQAVSHVDSLNSRCGGAMWVTGRQGPPLGLDECQLGLVSFPCRQRMGLLGQGGAPWKRTGPRSLTPPNSARPDMSGTAIGYGGDIRHEQGCLGLPQSRLRHLPLLASGCHSIALNSAWYAEIAPVTDIYMSIRL